MSGIIDNVDQKLGDVIKEALKDQDLERFRIAVGYFLISGLKEMLPELKTFISNGGQVDVLMGNFVNRDTYESLISAYKDLEFVRGKMKTAIDPNEKAVLHEGIETDAKGQVLYLPPTGDNEELIDFLIETIKSNQLHVKVYPRERFHAKAYVFDGRNKNALMHPGLVGVVGSSNFTLSGMRSNTELNASVYTHDAEALSEWFERQWEEGEDFTETFLRIFENSWASYIPGNLPKPYYVYLKAIYELYKRALETTEEILRTHQIYADLYEFQKWAVLKAVDTARKYNGVMVSDVTGMGKTYVGAAILEHFYHRNLSLGRRGRILIICPPKLKRNWEKIVSKYALHAQVLSMGKLSEEGFGSELLEEYGNTNVVLVDESHHFRNHNINRYKNLAHFLPITNEVVLLTATPYSKGPRDVYNQLKLFHYEDLTSIPITPPNLLEFTKLVEKDRADLTELLMHIMVRRTRYDILSQYGKTDDSGKQYLEFKGEKYYLPDRKLKTLNYEIEEVYKEKPHDENLYSQIVDTLENLTYARYSLGMDHYLKPEHKDKKKYQNLSNVGDNIRGLMKALLLKRLESSIYSFKETLRKMINSHRNFLRMLEAGKVAVGEGIDEVIREEEEFTRIGEILEEVIGSGKAEEYEIEAFYIKPLKEDLQQDIAMLEPLLKRVETIMEKVEGDYSKDNKIKKLAESIMKIRSGKFGIMEGPSQKILVFSQFADTVEHIYRGLRQLQKKNQLDPELRIERVTSDIGDADEIAERFAPRANEAVGYKPEEFIDVLIATDVMGEGLNLQDANSMINYDLHWNPLRLIQRIGRLDRLGTEHSLVYAFNFMPETSLESKLNIVKKVENRVNEFNNVLGNDGKILKEDEKLNPSFMRHVYQEDIKKVEEVEQEYLLGKDTVSQMVTKLRELLHQNEELATKLEQWNGIRSAKEWNQAKEAAFIVCRSGEYVTPYLVEFDQGDAKVIGHSSKDEILKAIHSEETEPPARVDKAAFRERYSKAAELALREFKKELQEREKIGKPKRNAAKQYVVGELRTLLERESDVERRKTLSHYIDLVNNTSIDFAISDFKRLKDNEVKGNNLLNAVEEIIGKYNLEGHQEKRKEIRESLNVSPHVVCGMYLVPK